MRLLDLNCQEENFGTVKYVCNACLLCGEKYGWNSRGLLP